MRNESQNENGGHDRRLIDLAAVLALLVLVVAAYAIIALDRPTLKLTSRIVPSQTVRW